MKATRTQWPAFHAQDRVVRNRAHTPADAKINVAKAVVTIHGAGSEDAFLKAFGILRLVTGQTPQVLYAKKSVAAVRLRKGDLQQVKVTLRGNRLRDFLTRRNRVALPALRDFEPLGGFPSDGTWNYHFPSASVFFRRSHIFRGQSQDRVRPPRDVQLVIDGAFSVERSRSNWSSRRSLAHLPQPPAADPKAPQWRPSASVVQGQSLTKGKRLQAITKVVRSGVPFPVASDA